MRYVFSLGNLINTGRHVFLCNGQSGNNANVTWSCQPIVLNAGRNIILNITGTFLADPLAGDPITLTLTNTTESY